VGAQTVILAKKSPEARIISMDISQGSIDQARRLLRDEGLFNVQFQRADIFQLPFQEDCFDHIFLCFVLEHLSDPLRATQELKKILRPGGTLTVIEGDHGSCYFHPETREALACWRSLNAVQAELGGNSHIGRELYPLLCRAGFREIRVSPRIVYSDASRPEMRTGFVENTIIAMVEGVKVQALQSGLVESDAWKKGIKDLHSTAGPDGTFCYTFFKGVGVK
jgi:SAM-dependent methyltransferase